MKLTPQKPKTSYPFIAGLLLVQTLVFGFLVWVSHRKDLLFLLGFYVGATMVYMEQWAYDYWWRNWRKK